jgi:hypothetical protein
MCGGEKGGVSRVSVVVQCGGAMSMEEKRVEFVQRRSGLQSRAVCVNQQKLCCARGTFEAWQKLRRTHACAHRHIHTY